MTIYRDPDENGKRWAYSIGDLLEHLTEDTERQARLVARYRERCEVLEVELERAQDRVAELASELHFARTAEDPTDSVIFGGRVLAVGEFVKAS